MYATVGESARLSEATELDQSLIVRASAGDRDAADKYFRRHWGSLTRTSRHIAGWRGDADDLLASAVSSAWAKWSTGAGPDRNVKGYLAQSMRNRLLDEIKSSRSSDVELEEEAVGSDARSDIDWVDARIDREIVREALQMVPDEQRALLVRLLVDGETARELADDLDRPTAWVHTRLYRSKRRLRGALMNAVLRRACRAKECQPRQDQFSLSSGGMLTGQEESKVLFALWLCSRCCSGLREFDALSNAS